jgi:hypothetical protein
MPEPLTHRIDPKNLRMPKIQLEIFWATIFLEKL